ncbi:MATE family efflux transporter [Clostridium puniceum]|uniref:MATE family efflux transporter n=1 Tax=Clostridium puniceum TaxID=29367 RepID=UPI001FA82F0C|nr:MATE family efflux transporter [Clostridium puniceum]
MIKIVYIAKAYLQAIAFSQVFIAIEIVSNVLFRGIGKPEVSAMISVALQV